MNIMNRNGESRFFGRDMTAYGQSYMSRLVCIGQLQPAPTEPALEVLPRKRTAEAPHIATCQILKEPHLVQLADTWSE